MGRKPTGRSWTQWKKCLLAITDPLTLKMGYPFAMRHWRDTVNFMAWHTIQDTLKLTGKSRSQLYRDMAKGLVSYRTGKDGRREFETSELIRVYGELNTSETPPRHRKGQSKKAIFRWKAYS